MALDRKKLCPPVLSGVRSHSSSWVELGMVPCPTQMSNTGIKHAYIRVQKPFAILSVSNQFLNLIPLKPCTLRVTCYLVIPIDTCQCWLCDSYQSPAFPTPTPLRPNRTLAAKLTAVGKCTQQTSFSYVSQRQSRNIIADKSLIRCRMTAATPAHLFK